MSVIPFKMKDQGLRKRKKKEKEHARFGFVIPEKFSVVPLKTSGL